MGGQLQEVEETMSAVFWAFTHSLTHSLHSLTHSLQGFHEIPVGANMPPGHIFLDADTDDNEETHNPRRLQTDATDTANSTTTDTLPDTQDVRVGGWFSSFFSSVWNGIKAIGKAIAAVAETVVTVIKVLATGTYLANGRLGNGKMKFAKEEEEEGTRLSCKLTPAATPFTTFFTPQVIMTMGQHLCTTKNGSGTTTAPRTRQARIFLSTARSRAPTATPRRVSTSNLRSTSRHTR